METDALKAVARRVLDVVHPLDISMEDAHLLARACLGQSAGPAPEEDAIKKLISDLREEAKELDFDQVSDVLERAAAQIEHLYRLYTAVIRAREMAAFLARDNGEQHARSG